MAFQEGKKAVCIKKGLWNGPGAPTRNQVPAYNEIVTVSTIHVDDEGEWLTLKEYPTHEYVKGRPPKFNAIHFRPVDYSTGEKVCEYIKEECEKESKPEPALSLFDLMKVKW